LYIHSLHLANLAVCLRLTSTHRQLHLFLSLSLLSMSRRAFAKRFAAYHQSTRFFPSPGVHLRSTSSPHNSTALRNCIEHLLETAFFLTSPSTHAQPTSTFSSFIILQSTVQCRSYLFLSSRFQRKGSRER
jgi:hypothetical protein